MRAKEKPAQHVNAKNRANRRSLRATADSTKRVGAPDFDAINKAALAAFPAVLARLLPKGKRVGAELVALNPRRADCHLGSFKVNRYNGRWADFATGDKGGDPISLAAYLASTSQGEAARLLARMLGIEAGGRAMPDDGFDFSPLTPEEREAAPQEAAPEGEANATKPTIPPAEAEEPEVAAKRLFGRKPDGGPWPYLLASGETAFYVCRYNKKGGRKDFYPLCWFPNGGWISKHWPAPRPLYNLDKICSPVQSRRFAAVPCAVWRARDRI